MKFFSTKQEEREERREAFEQIRLDPHQRAIRFMSFFAGIANAFLRSPHVNVVKPFWEVFIDYAGSFIGQWALGAFIFLFIAEFMHGIGEMMKNDDPPPHLTDKTLRVIYRIILALLVLFIIPLIHVSCERNFK